MSIQRAAQLQVLLEGVPLPASKRRLIDYARREDQDAARVLEALPDREYRSLDEVGEALSPVQPSRSRGEPPPPREESGNPPGGDDYTRPRPEPGAVRPSPPLRTPAQQVIEQQSKTQQKQKQRADAEG